MSESKFKPLSSILSGTKSVLNSKPVKQTVHTANKNKMTTALIVLLVVMIICLLLCMLSYGVYAFVRKPKNNDIDD